MLPQLAGYMAFLFYLSFVNLGEMTGLLCTVATTAAVGSAAVAAAAALAASAAVVLAVVLLEM